MYVYMHARTHTGLYRAQVYALAAVAGRDLFPTYFLLFFLFFSCTHTAHMCMDALLMLDVILTLHTFFSFFSCTQVYCAHVHGRAADAGRLLDVSHGISHPQ